VDDGLLMDVLHAGDELIGEEKDSLQGELAIAEVEEVLQTRSEEIDDHSLVLTLSSEPADKWDTNTTDEGLVDTSLVFELRVLGLDALELDSNLFTWDYVGSEVDVAERATTDLPTDTVLVANAKILHDEVSIIMLKRWITTCDVAMRNGRGSKVPGGVKLKVTNKHPLDLDFKKYQRTGWWREGACTTLKKRSINQILGISTWKRVDSP
jgi:hypothetical protein